MTFLGVGEFRGFRKTRNTPEAENTSRAVAAAYDLPMRNPSLSRSTEKQPRAAERSTPRKSSAASTRAAMILAALMSIVGAEASQPASAQEPVKKQSKESGKKLPPRPLSFTEIEKLAEQMGDEDFVTRELAYDQLLKRLDKDTIAYLAPAAHSKDLEIAKRTKNILGERQKLIDAQFPIPKEAREQWFWSQKFDDTEKFSHTTPEGEVMTYSRISQLYNRESQFQGGQNSSESDWSDLKMTLTRVATEKRDHAFLEAARWTDDDEEELNTWEMENRGGDRRAGKKLILDRKMSGVIPSIGTHIKPFVDASLEWRKKNPPRPMPPPMIEEDPIPDAPEEAFWRQGSNPIVMASRGHTERARRVLKAG